MPSLNEYPELQEDYDLEAVKKEIAEWHSYFLNEHLQEGRMISGETTEDVAQDFQNRDKMAVELVKTVLPRVLDKHKKEE